MRRRPLLAPKYRRIIKRAWLVIRIPDKMACDLCDLMECKHDHPRRVAMKILQDGIVRAKRGLAEKT